MQSSDSHVESLFCRAREAAGQGRKTEARRLLWAALQLAPDDASLWIWLAGVSSSPRASLGYLARALTLDPDNSRARAGIRWARRQQVQSGRQAIVPAAAVARIRPGARTTQIPLWPWAVGVAISFLLVGLLAIYLFFPDLTALAAGDPLPFLSGDYSSHGAATPTTLPTRTQALPATWTTTPTRTPSPTATPTTTASPTATPSPTATATPVPPSPTWVPTLLPSPIPPGSAGERWIDVNLSQQLLIAYEGTVPIRWVTISSGLPATPTVVGQFRIYVKYVAADMSGDDYYLPGVPYVMYFFRGYGLHGTYWHSNFGYPMSHGCVNLPTPEAEWLFNFASVGTLVNIHY